MNIYIFMGGAYGDEKWSQTTPPDADQWASWSNGELEIFKVDSELRVYEPHDSGMWALLKQEVKQ